MYTKHISISLGRCKIYAINQKPENSMPFSKPPLTSCS